MKKSCNNCGEVKPLSEFYKQKNGKNGRKAICKQCYNPKIRIAKEKRENAIKAVPNKLKEREAELIRKHYQYECALTCKYDTVALDHFVPLSWGPIVKKFGIGGTTYANMIPFHRSINSSKGGMNPFIWFARYGLKHGVSSEKWNNAVQYIAEKHGISTFDYINKVNACYSEVLALRWVADVNSRIESEGYHLSHLIERALRMNLNIPVVVELFGSSITKEIFLEKEATSLLNEKKAWYESKFKS